MDRKNLLTTILVAVLFVTGCAHGRYCQTRRLPPKGVYHTVKLGQTLWRIARTYGVPLEEVVRVNSIEDATSIRVDQRIFIPGTTRILEVEVYRPSETKEEVTCEIDFIWPLKGEIISGFGGRGTRIHNGIDIKAKEGTEFIASADGVVGYCGRLRGYGNVIIIKHNETYSTVYAHNQVNLVTEGESVRQNEVIGRVGATGRTTTCHLHFEIRKKGWPKNPILYLP